MINTQQRLEHHHGDLKEFAQKMITSYEKRYTPTFWTFWNKHVTSTPDKILDLGTGPGLFLNELQKIYPDTKLTGVDAQPEMAILAKKTMNSGIELIVHDLTVTPNKHIKDSSVDVVHSMMTVHELHTPTPLYQEVSRVLASNGVAIIQDWIKIPMSEYFDELPKNPDEINHYAEHCLMTEQDHFWLANSCGLEVKEYLIINNRKHILMALQKKGQE